MVSTVVETPMNQVPLPIEGQESIEAPAEESMKVLVPMEEQESIEAPLAMEEQESIDAPLVMEEQESAPVQEPVQKPEIYVDKSNNMNKIILIILLILLSVFIYRFSN